MVRQRLYYSVKPFIPATVRLTLRRIHARGIRRRCGDVWPIMPGSERPLLNVLVLVVSIIAAIIFFICLAVQGATAIQWATAIGFALLVVFHILNIWLQKPPPHSRHAKE